MENQESYEFFPMPNKALEHLTPLANEIYQANKAKGFWDKERNVGELLMLVTSELGEALEAHRKGRLVKQKDDADYVLSLKGDSQTSYFAEYIKDTFEDEIADAIIRLFDLSGGLGIDIGAHIQAKLEYNKTRERLHGKKY